MGAPSGDRDHDPVGKDGMTHKEREAARRILGSLREAFARLGATAEAERVRRFGSGGREAEEA